MLKEGKRVFRNEFRSDLYSARRFQYNEIWLLVQINKPWYSFNNRSLSPPMPHAETGPRLGSGCFDPPTMASQTPVPKSHWKYDLRTDEITITAHTPQMRLGADAKDVTIRTRGSGESKEDPLVVEEDDEVPEVNKTSSIGLSSPGTSWQTANPGVAVSTTLVFLSVICITCLCRTQLSLLGQPKPRT